MEDDLPPDIPDSIVVDYKESPDDVIERVNELLAQHGLKFVEIPDASDQFIFALEKT